MSKKIIIVGGVAGGASAAARARRLSEDAEIILIERDEYISFANCGLPYYIGGTITDRQRLLVQTPGKMQQQFNIDIRVRQEVTSIDREQQTITILDKNTEHEYTESYDHLILSPGAKPLVPPIPGIDHPSIMTLRNMHDMDQINAWISEHEPKKAVVIGAGYIGLEMSEALHQRNIAVTLVEMAPQVMNALDPEMATLLHQELTEKGVQLNLSNAVTGFEPLEQGIQILLKNGNPIQADLVILAIGVKPENQLAKACGLEIGRCGGVLVNEHMQTADPIIYAVGDVVEVNHLVGRQQTLLPLAGPANRQGRIAADHIFGRNSRYRKSQGTGICKVFDLTAAMTGMNEKTLRASQMNYEKIYLNENDHAGYYPGATPIALKVLFHPETGQLLGAQAVGNKGIDKRIDVLALAIRAQLTVFDLEHAELAYAPPYGSAKDIINYAGFVAVNWMRGDSNMCHVQDVLNKDEKTLLLDIRTRTEYKNGTIPNAINIPLSKLREELNQLDKNKKIIVFCKSGPRAHNACRILMQKGFDCRNLSGGYEIYMLATGTYQKDPNKGITPATKAMPLEMKISKSIDACGMQCPGPILKLKEEIETLETGNILSITTSDKGFLRDAPAWCRQAGHELLKTVSENGLQTSYIRKQTSVCSTNTSLEKNMSVVVFDDNFDRAVAAFIIANGAAAMGYKPTLFFTFWGLNVLRRGQKVAVKKTWIEKIFGFLMPRGAQKIALSKLHMAGLGTSIMKNIMRKKQVMSLPEMIQMAQKSGVKLVACSMTMDLMGIHKEELIPGVEIGGVATYLDQADQSRINLFI